MKVTKTEFKQMLNEAVNYAVYNILKNNDISYLTEATRSKKVSKFDELFTDTITRGYRTITYTLKGDFTESGNLKELYIEIRDYNNNNPSRGCKLVTAFYNSARKLWYNNDDFTVGNEINSYLMLLPKKQQKIINDFKNSAKSKSLRNSSPYDR